MKKSQLKNFIPGTASFVIAHAKRQKSRGRRPSESYMNIRNSKKALMRAKSMDALGAQPFHISDVLTITTGRLVSTRHMDGVYEILNFMTDDSLFTHQLPRASNECKPRLLDQFPFLRDIDVSGINEETWKSWLSSQVSKFGGYHDVIPLNSEDHKKINPIEEIVDLIGEDKVLVI
ncbi:hypothetical protein D4R87_00410 [bacterium]|nr:MAG: hypothetical protein D4R87_00410 [bacterium]